MGLGDGIKPANSISAATFNRFIQDAGVVYKDYGLPGQVALGVSRGGNSLTINEEQREMPTDGASGPVKGSKRIIRTEASITLNLLEMSTASLVAMLPASVSSIESTYDKIVRSRQIGSSDYFENIALVVDKSDSSGEYFVCILNNALSSGEVELGTTDDDESVVPVTFTAHFDPDDLSTVPWEIRNPKEDLITTYTLTYNAGLNGSILGTSVQTVASGNSGSQVAAIADAGFYFVNWDDASTANPRTDTNVTANLTVSANFSAV